MAQSLSSVTVHIVFSVKERQPLLADQDLRERLHAELGGTSKRLDCPPIIVGGVDDHVHLLARQSRTITLADWMKELKRVTSIWIKDQDARYRQFRWQAGYGAFSVSQSQVSDVVRYIKSQEEHHENRDFKSEFRALLERHGIEYDERYVWD